MKQKFIVYGIKPISVNATLIPNFRGFTKSSAASEYTSQLFYQLGSEENLKKLKELREFFNEKIHCYRAQITIFYPKNKFYTKKNTISSNTIDVTNYEKPIIDALFLPKYFNLSNPSGLENLNVDDKFLVEMVSKKRPYDKDDYEIHLELEILNINVINNID